MTEFIIVALISCLMGMGVGGGGLYIIYLTLIKDTPQMIAQGTNLLFFIMAGVGSLCLHLRKRHIYPVQLLLLVAFGCLGSFIFSRIGNNLDPEIPKNVLGSVLILGGGLSIFQAICSFKK
ncbi:MAG: TSUP family transporter [Clostridia bacterium]|nr:TSUP family transporter [Clostridia bacterium]